MQEGVYNPGARKGVRATSSASEEMLHTSVRATSSSAPCVYNVPFSVVRERRHHRNGCVYHVHLG